MIKSFSCKNTKELKKTSKSRKFDSRIVKRAIVKLDQLDAAQTIEDLRIPPSNHLEQLKGDEWKDFHSIRVTKQWRLCFKWVDGHAEEVIITDYH